VHANTDRLKSIRKKCSEHSIWQSIICDKIYVAHGSNASICDKIRYRVIAVIQTEIIKSSKHDTIKDIVRKNCLSGNASYDCKSLRTRLIISRCLNFAKSSGRIDRAYDRSMPWRNLSTNFYHDNVVKCFDDGRGQIRTSRYRNVDYIKTDKFKIPRGRVFNFP